MWKFRCLVNDTRLRRLSYHDNLAPKDDELTIIHHLWALSSRHVKQIFESSFEKKFIALLTQCVTVSF